MVLLSLIIFIAIIKSIFVCHHHCHFFRGILGGIFLSWLFGNHRNRPPYHYRNCPYDGTDSWY